MLCKTRETSISLQALLLILFQEKDFFRRITNVVVKVADRFGDNFSFVCKAHNSFRKIFMEQVNGSKRLVEFQLN